MGQFVTLTPATKAIIQGVFDDLIAEFGKDCRLVYPPRWVACVNCKLDPIGNKSSNVWKTGGPMQFPNGTACPMCNGAGREAAEVSEVVHWSVIWEPKAFYVPVPNVDLRVPFGVIQTKSLMSDVPKILRADHLVVELPIEPILRQAYKLSGEPGDPSNIIQGRYAVATWTRIAA